MEETPLQKRQRLNQEIEADAEALKRKKEALSRIDRECQHVWGETIPDHIYHKAYTIPGDPPGTMGVDWRGDCHVPAKTEKRWKRVCKKCGKVEHTSRTTKKEVETPRF